MDAQPASVKAYAAAFARVDAAAPDWEAFTSKGGVLALADAAASEGHMAPSRQAYPALLARFPLCFGFWKRWALQEWAQGAAPPAASAAGRAAALAASAAVWEAGARAATHSAEHWANYCEFLGAQCGVEDPARVRAALLRAVAVCTLDPKAGALWESLLRLEASAAAGGGGGGGGGAPSLGALFARVLASGAPYVPLLWGKFQALAAATPPLQLLGEGEASAGAPLAAAAAAAAAAPASEACAQALRAAILARREAAVAASLQESAARSAAEAAVGRRPYFHVKPLDAAVLQVRRLRRGPARPRGREGGGAAHFWLWPSSPRPSPPPPTPPHHTPPPLWPHNAGLARLPAAGGGRL